jgi:hypothetical protein
MPSRITPPFCGYCCVPLRRAVPLTISAVAAEGVNRPRSGDYFTTVPYTPCNEILLARPYWNPLALDEERVAALHNQHVFVILMHMLVGHRVFGASPKRHLASVFSIEDVTFNAPRRLIRAGDPVRWMFHELWKGVHEKRY